MSEPTVPGFLFDSVQLSIFDKTVLKGGGSQAGGNSYGRQQSRGNSLCLEGPGVKEGKPALVLSSDVPKFWSHLVAEMRRNRRERRHKIKPLCYGKLCLEAPLRVPRDPKNEFKYLLKGVRKSGMANQREERLNKSTRY